MAQKKTLSAKRVVADIRAGATNDFLMKKYELSEKGLQSLFQKLLSAKLLAQEDLDRRVSEQIMVEEVCEVSAEEQSEQAKAVGVEKSKTALASDKDGNEIVGAARNRNFRRIQELVVQGANINATDEEGDTALIVACREGHLQAVKYLIERGADVTIKNKVGEDALRVASAKAHKDIVAIIQRRIQVLGEFDKELKRRRSTASTSGPTELKDWNGQPWYENTALLLLALLCFPVAAYGLYKNTKLSRKTKIIAVGVFCGLIAIGGVIQAHEDRVRKEQERVQKEQEEARKKEELARLAPCCDSLRDYARHSALHMGALINLQAAHDNKIEVRPEWRQNEEILGRQLENFRQQCGKLPPDLEKLVGNYVMAALESITGASFPPSEQRRREQEMIDLCRKLTGGETSSDTGKVQQGLRAKERITRESGKSGLPGTAMFEKLSKGLVEDLAQVSGVRETSMGKEPLKRYTDRGTIIDFVGPEEAIKYVSLSITPSKDPPPHYIGRLLENTTDSRETPECLSGVGEFLEQVERNPATGVMQKKTFQCGGRYVLVSAGKGQATEALGTITVMVFLDATLFKREMKQYGVEDLAEPSKLTRQVESHEIQSSRGSQSRPQFSSKFDPSSSKKLIEASYQGKVDAVSRLLAANADPNARGNEEATALMAASLRGHVAVAELLIRAGADVNAKDSQGWTALRYAIQNGHARLVDLLKTNGARE